MTTWLAHGFAVRDGGHGSVGKLRPYIEERPHLYSYGWTGLLGLKCANMRAINDLIKKIEVGDSIIAHSNGCLIAWQMAEIMGDYLSSVVCINPALRRDTLWHPRVPVLCLANHTDWVVQLGRIWGRLFPVDGVQAQGWGAAGRYGFTAKQELVENWDTAEIWWEHPVKGHSGIFADDVVAYWGNKINRWQQLTKRIRDGH